MPCEMQDHVRTKVCAGTTQQPTKRPRSPNPRTALEFPYPPNEECIARNEVKGIEQYESERDRNHHPRAQKRGSLMASRIHGLRGHCP